MSHHHACHHGRCGVQNDMPVNRSEPKERLGGVDRHSRVIAVACLADGGTQQSGCVRGSDFGSHWRPLITHRVHPDAECGFEGKRRREAGCARLCAGPGTWRRLGAIGAVTGLAALHALLVTVGRGMMCGMRRLRCRGRSTRREELGDVGERLHGQHEANPQDQQSRHHASVHKDLASSADDAPLWFSDCSGFRPRVKR